MISILLVLCLILVIASMLIALSATSRLDLLRRHNQSMQTELTQLREDYQSLQILLTPIKTNESPAETMETATEKPPEVRAHEQLLEQINRFAAGLLKYAERNAGLYPASLENMQRFAETMGINQTAQNPYSGIHGKLFSADSVLDITHEPTDEGLSEYAGKILYQAQLTADGHAIDFTLAAFDGEGMILKAADGDVLTFTKSSHFDKALSESQ